MRTFTVWIHWADRQTSILPYRSCLRYFGKDNCKSQSPSKIHQMPESSFAGRMKQIALGTYKLPYFKHKIMLWGLYICKKGPYSLLILFFFFGSILQWLFQTFWFQLMLCTIVYVCVCYDCLAVISFAYQCLSISNFI